MEPLNSDLIWGSDPISPSLFILTRGFRPIFINSLLQRVWHKKEEGAFKGPPYHIKLRGRQSHILGECSKRTAIVKRGVPIMSRVCIGRNLSSDYCGDMCCLVLNSIHGCHNFEFWVGVHYMASKKLKIIAAMNSNI